MVHGKKKYKYVYGNTQKEVRQKANEIEYKKNNNLYVNPKNMYMSEFLEEWLDLHKTHIANTTKKLYDMYLEKHINPTLGKLKLNKIMPIHIEKFYAEKMKKQKGKTVRKYHNLLHKAFDYALKNELIAYNPCDRVQKPKIEKYKPNICNDETFIKLIEITRGTFDIIPIILAAGLDLRRGEVFGLKWTDIDFNKKTVKIEETKVRFNKYVRKNTKTESSTREIVAPDIVLDILNDYKKNTKVLSKYVCDQYQPDSFSKHFKKLLKDNKLPEIRFHDLRHYNAILMMKLGIPDKIAAKRMGHATTKTLQEIYQHATDDMDLKAAQKINDELKRKLGGI